MELRVTELQSVELQVNSCSLILGILTQNSELNLPLNPYLLPLTPT
jgi:hypothetical protein